MTENNIFDFNHISPDLTIEQELELKSYYENCHLKCFLYKKAFQYYKKISNMDVDFLVY